MGMAVRFDKQKYGLSVIEAYALLLSIFKSIYFAPKSFYVLFISDISKNPVQGQCVRPISS
jgi:hypothetical protein